MRATIEDFKTGWFGIRIFLFLAVLTTLCACFPYRYTMTPVIQGTAVDSQTKQPIVGGKVRLTVGRAGSIYFRSFETTTDQAGHYLIPTLKAWGVWVMPQEPYRPHGKLIYEAPGFQTFEKDLDPSDFNRDINCELKKLP